MEKKRIVSIAKNILISILFVLSIFQVNRLWLGSDGFIELIGGMFSNRSIEGTDNDALIKLTTPFRIITAGNEGRYHIIYNNINASPQRTAADNAITFVLKNGSSSSLPYDPLLEALIIYEYAVPIPANVFDQRFNHIISNRINAVDAIYFVVDYNEITIIFADRTSGRMLEYWLNDKNIYESIIAAAVTTDVVFYYERAYGTFIPRWFGSWYLFNMVAIDLNFPAPTLGTVERAILPFFDRPSAVIARIADDLFLDSDVRHYVFSGDSSERVIVRYFYMPRVLEYSNYSFIPSETLHSFIQSFALALNVINRDHTLQNEIFLSHYTTHDAGFTFYFNAAINNFPVAISSELARISGMENFIEVTVTQNHIRYRRYAAVFRVDEAESSADTGFDEFMQRHMMFTGGQVVNENNNHNLWFGYMATNESYMILHWSTDLFDQVAVAVE